MPWKQLTLTAVVILLILWLLVFGINRDPRYIHSPLVGQTAPSFTMSLFNTKTLRLEDLRGKAVFLNFWASWCNPCREEARNIAKAWKQSQRGKVFFIGINIQDKTADAMAFLKEFQIRYTNGQDSNGSISIDYGVWGIPESFFIDPNGIITYKHVGAISTQIIISKLEEALLGKVSAEEGSGHYQSIR